MNARSIALVAALGLSPAVHASAQVTSAGALGCKLFDRDAAHVPTEQCVSCHGAQSHPVDVDYGVAQRGRASGFRSLEEVVQRGVFLPGGKLTCLTCHEASSPWKHRIALPPGAGARPAVNPRDATTYARQAPRTGLPPGSAVTPTPLCLACHAFD